MDGIDHIENTWRRLCHHALDGWEAALCKTLPPDTPEDTIEEMVRVGMPPFAEYHAARLEYMKTIAVEYEPD